MNIEASLTMERDAYRSRLAQFVEQYAGTETALLTEVDLLTDRIGPSMIDTIDGFVREHPNTAAAAKALYLEGANLGHNASSFGERKGDDPTERFFRVLEIYEQLRSGRFPQCEWVEKAPSLVAEFFTYEPKYAAANIERLLDAYERILPVLLANYEKDPAQDSVAYVIGSKMGALFKLKGDAIAGIEGVFERLERAAGNRDAVRLLRAELYLRPNDPVIDAEDRPALIDSSRRALAALARDGRGYYQRKALATLARLHFGEGKHAEARELYDRFVASFPDSPYAWVAALRSAQSIEASSTAAAAIPRFAAAADRFSGNPLARVLGLTYAARAAEAAERYDAARKYYRDARSAWDADYGLTYSLYATRPLTPGDPFRRVDDAAVQRDALDTRIDELAQSTRAEGGALVERARWLLARGRWDEAAATITEFFGKHQHSPIGDDARLVGNTARLEAALALVDAGKTETDISGPIAALQALTNEPPDFAVVAAKIALATISFLSGSGGDPDALMAEAMKMWRSLDASRTRAAGALAREVVEIRNAVFRPTGGGMYDTGHWNAFKWGTGVRFYTADPELIVKSASGEISTITAYDSFPEFENVLFLDDDRRKLLERVMLRLGGTKRRPWTQVMATPNQPAGAAVNVAVLWKKYFWTQPGHWGGWVFESYPIITEIEFIDAARTRAAVNVTVGYSGATVQMEKKDGVWVARELTNFWIT